MQTIFYNAKVYTLNKLQPNAEAFLVNDENIVFVGSNKEVLELKQDETKLVDMKEKVILPSFFDNNISLYKIIEQNLKNAKMDNFLENNDEIDENYYNFTNYEIYKQEFLKVQNELLKEGISTVQEINVSSKEFTFWKRLSEENLLKVDIIAYIDMVNHKAVMDNNCRSYRKYKNHFRVGGYYISIDGSLLEGKAWLDKPYKKEKHYNGYSLILEERLAFLIKNAFEEKKQLMIETNGDKALKFFINTYEDVAKKEKVEENYRPIALHCTFISSDDLKKMKELKITPTFCVSELHNESNKIKRFLGYFRNKKVYPLKSLKDNNVEFLIHSKDNEILSSIKLANFSLKSNLSKKAKSEEEIQELYNKLINGSAYITFDEEKKGTIESGKYANFVVIDGNTNLLNKLDLEKIKIDELYFYGEKQVTI